MTTINFFFFTLFIMVRSRDTGDRIGFNSAKDLIVPMKNKTFLIWIEKP